MYIVNKTLDATCTAHYLGKGYPKACKNNHGHNYHFQVKIKGKSLNEYDMLVDFGDIKKHCTNWLQENWDHIIILSSFQKDAIPHLEALGWRYIMFPVEEVNTTAERMSEFLTKKFYKELKEIYPSIEDVSVGVWETDGSVAWYELEEDEKIL